MATIAVQEAKKRHPDLYAYRMAPYLPGEYSAPVPEFFDDVFYPLEMEEAPRRLTAAEANRRILKECDCLVAYVCREDGASGVLLRWARRMEKKGLMRVINLGTQ